MTTENLFRWACFIAIFLSALGVVSCQAEAPPSEPVTLVFGVYPYNREYFEPLVEEFQQGNPTITIELEELPFTQRINIRDYPQVDVFGVDLDFFLQNQVEETLTDLSPLIGQDKSFDLADFYPGMVDLFTSGGKILAVPAGIDPFVMYFNKDLFNQNGLPYPTEGWTWDDMLTAALAIQDDSSNTFGYGVFEQHLDLNALILINQHGGQSFDDLNNPSQLIFNHPLNIEAMQWYGNLFHLHYVAPTLEQAGYAFGFGNQAIRRGVLQGKIGMWPGYFSERNGITWPTDWENLSWGMVMLPRDINSVTSGFGNGYAISATSQNPETAWKWLAFLSEQVPQFAMPARRSLAESKDFEDRFGQEVAAAARTSAETIVLVNPNLMQFESDLQYFHQAVLDIMNGKATAQEALDWAQEQIESP